MIDRKFFVDEGRKGGKNTFKKYGADHFSKIGKLGVTKKELKRLANLRKTIDNL